MKSVNFMCEKVLINPKGRMAFYIMRREVALDAELFPGEKLVKRYCYNLVVDFYENDEYIPLIENMEYTLSTETCGAFDGTWEEEKPDAYRRIYEIICRTKEGIEKDYYHKASVSIDYPECKNFSADKPIIENAFIFL